MVNAQDERIATLEADARIKAANLELAQARVAELEGVLRHIVAADWRGWHELASPDEFVRWAKSRANHALSKSDAAMKDHHD